MSTLELQATARRDALFGERVARSAPVALNTHAKHLYRPTVRRDWPTAALRMVRLARLAVKRNGATRCDGPICLDLGHARHAHQPNAVGLGGGDNLWVQRGIAGHQ